MDAAMSGMGSTTREAWEQLQFHWDDAYIFRHIPGSAEPFTAQRRDNREVITAEDPFELMQKVSEDYRIKPVPRQEFSAELS
jgi:hypothetical protein